MFSNLFPVLTYKNSSLYIFTKEIPLTCIDSKAGYWKKVSSDQATISFLKVV